MAQRIVRAAVAALVVSSAAIVRAQVPASSFDELRLKTEVGRRVTVVGADGEALTGRLTELTPSTLAVLSGDEPHRFERWQVRLVEERYHDPVLNGVAIGALSASVPALLLTINYCPTCLQVAAAYAVIGAGIGALVDSAVTTERTLYLPPAIRPAGARMTIAPVMSRRRAGLRVAFRF